MKLEKVKVISNVNLRKDYYLMKLEYKDSLLAKPGQFLMIKCSNLIYPLLRRPFAIHKVNKDSFEILYKVVGEGTKILSEKRKGDEIDILGPLGKGFTLDHNFSSTVILGTGVGCAPLLFLAEELSKRNKKIFILLGGKDESFILRSEEFKKFGECFFILKSKGESVFSFFKDFIKDKKTFVYVCTNRALSKEIGNFCKIQNIPCEISLESHMGCGIGVCLGCVIYGRNNKFLKVCKDGPVFSAKEVDWTKY